MGSRRHCHQRSHGLRAQHQPGRAGARIKSCQRGADRQHTFPQGIRSLLHDDFNSGSAWSSAKEFPETTSASGSSLAIFHGPLVRSLRRNKFVKESRMPESWCPPLVPGSRHGRGLGVDALCGCARCGEVDLVTRMDPPHSRLSGLLPHVLFAILVRSYGPTPGDEDEDVAVFPCGLDVVFYRSKRGNMAQSTDRGTPVAGAMDAVSS